MRLLTLALATLLLLLPSPSGAEETLVIYDSQNRIIGQVVGFRGSGNPWTELPFAPLVLIRHQGHDLLFSADAEGLFNGVPVYFSGPSCTGTALIVPTSPANFGNLFELQHRIYATGPGNILYWAAEGGATSGINYQSWARDGSNCQASPGTTSFPPLVAAVLVDLDDLATPPLTLKGNPLIFRDGFETGQADRWLP